MKKTLTIVTIVAAILVVIYLATRNMDALGFLKQLHGG